MAKEIPRIVVGVIIYNKNHEIFLACSHKWNNKWVVPGGHLEIGETLQDCVKREVKEETNIDVSDIELVEIRESIFPKEYHQKRHMVFIDYSCKAKNNEIKLNSELQEYKWINPKEALKKLDLNSSTKIFIEKFIEKNR